jgi:hypothetical protein
MLARIQRLAWHPRVIKRLPRRWKQTMSLSHRSLRFWVGFLAVFTLGSLYAPQGALGQPPTLPPGAINIMVPQFVAEAVRFKAIDESGYDWAGSDEVYAVFSDLNPTLNDLVTSEYEGIDSGDTQDFGPDERCIVPRPNCDHGVSESLHFQVSFWERDKPWRPFVEFCYGDAPGLHYLLHHGKCSWDDLIGRGEVLLSREQLLAALPGVGESVEYKLILGGLCGPSDADVVGCGPPGPYGPEYEFTYRIKRLPDVERPLVIAPPR